MQDFVYVKNDLLIPLGDEITIFEQANEEEVLISNEKSQKAQIYAPEINFYLKNSKDEILKQSKNVSKLYEARALVYDLGLDLEQSKSVGANLIIASEQNTPQNENLTSFLKEQGFKIIRLSYEELISVYGSIGELCAVVRSGAEELELDFDILLFEGTPRSDFTRQSGCYDLANFKDQNELLAFLKTLSPRYSYKTFFTYESKTCQYHERRSEHCAKCVEICPTTAILKDDENKHLEFSQIDCVDCGACVGICPSGSLDYAPMSRQSFLKLCKFYEGQKILLVSKDKSLESLNISLPQDTLPLMIEANAFLTPLHLLTLLQSSGANIAFYTGTLSEGLSENIDFLNAVFERKFNKKAIFLAQDEKELEACLEKLEFIENLCFDYHNNAQTTRESFAHRLKALIKDENLGVIESKNWLRYGQVKINADTCTLCLSCVGACNVGALIADTKENALKFNPSLCTTCGYCEQSCAEKDTLKLERSGFELESSYFEFKAMAKDELFACVKCGKEFATKKAVEKIANLMKPRFAGDESKILTLYCCADCKARVMIEAMGREFKL
ncbi:ferredoxin [Campylobacter sp. MIT 99-7217]|uniref:4Fe-4S dicluster domain-containing protein n=1 Tax=Campylobacter sp. MIT 99-7217 TaxID=535091 RepID=UPI00115A962D|nr:4Fe-4S dicluster domain-containing protein [Campylobacter sp. MIT 99-7217]TQR30333.1 ferredoxin [Campylobacter sp. MIT 99-7217]